MAGELTVVNSQVPAEIGELVNFVKLGREQLKIARDGLKMVDKMNLENEKRTAALRQVQELSEQLIDAEMKLGAIMATLPTAPGARTDLDEPEDSAVPRTKQAILKLAGFSTKTAQRFETLAAHPEIVEKMKVEAHVNGTVLSRTAILRAIDDEGKKEYDKEHLSLSEYELKYVMSMLGENYTFLPDSSDTPIEEQTWEGSILLIPPKSEVDDYIFKLQNSFDSISEALVIVPDDIHAFWYQRLMFMANAVIYRNYVEVQTIDGDDTVNTSDGFAFVYIGKNASDFLDLYRMNGWGHSVNKVVSRMFTQRYKK